MTIPGGRKFVVVVLALVFSFILALLQRLTADWALVISVCVGAFLGAHAVADYRNGKP